MLGTHKRQTLKDIEVPLNITEMRRKARQPIVRPAEGETVNPETDYKIVHGEKK